jgi:hypothetical protein
VETPASLPTVQVEHPAPIYASVRRLAVAQDEAKRKTLKDERQKAEEQNKAEFKSQALEVQLARKKPQDKDSHKASEIEDKYAAELERRAPEEVLERPTSVVVHPSSELSAVIQGEPKQVATGKRGRVRKLLLLMKKNPREDVAKQWVVEEQKRRENAAKKAQEQAELGIVSSRPVDTDIMRKSSQSSHKPELPTCACDEGFISSSHSSPVTEVPSVAHISTEDSRGAPHMFSDS